MISEEKRQVIKFFAEGRELYKQRRFSDARLRFVQALKIDRNDTPSVLYYRRCEHFIQEPPPSGWNGVFVLKTK